MIIVWIYRVQGQASKWIVLFCVILCQSCAAPNNERFCHWFCLSNNVNKHADATSIKTCTERDYPLGRLSLYYVSEVMLHKVWRQFSPSVGPWVNMKTLFWLMLVTYFSLCWATFRSEARTPLLGSLIQDLNNINKMDLNIFSNFGHRDGTEVIFAFCLLGFK